MIYGLLLLGQLWMLFRVWEAAHPSGGTITQIQGFAEDAFIQFAGAQGLALLLLIPALVAGMISDEYQRKTLHYLLASRLSSAEIVLGKLAARLVHVVAFVALGLPIVALVMLYGGLNPISIFYVYFGTTTMVLFVTGFSTLISILARRLRDAILAVYGVGAIWLLVPISGLTKDLDGALAWVRIASDGLLYSNPIKTWSIATRSHYDLFTGQFTPGWAASWNSFEWIFALMAISQGTFGLLFLIGAIAGLRPLRGSSWPGARPQTGWWTRLSARYRRFIESRSAAALTRNELLATRAVRPACGEDPMLWKERFTRMSGGLKWMGSRPVALFFIVLLGCFLFDLAAPAFDRSGGRFWQDRTIYQINLAIRSVSAALAVLAILPISAAAASSITSEREQDTWISLATTLLTAREVIRGKQVGALWSAALAGYRAGVDTRHRAADGSDSSDRAGRGAGDPGPLRLARRSHRRPGLDPGAELDPGRFPHVRRRIPGHKLVWLAGCSVVVPGVLSRHGLLLDRPDPAGIHAVDLLRAVVCRSRGDRLGQFPRGGPRHILVDQAAARDMGKRLIPAVRRRHVAGAHRPRRHDQKQPPWCLAEIGGIRRHVIDQAHLGRQGARGERWDAGDRSADRVDDRAKARICRPDQVSPVLDRAEGGDQVVLVRCGGLAEPRIKSQVYEQLSTLLRRPAGQRGECVLITNQRSGFHCLDPAIGDGIG